MGLGQMVMGYAQGRGKVSSVALEYALSDKH